MTAKKRIGIALGSGSARGLAHVGVLRRLKELGIEPDIVTGCSVGAIVGACYMSGKIDEFFDWIKDLTNREMLYLADLNFPSGGGVASGERLISHFKKHYGNPDIESLDKPFAAVATDLYLGREIWLQEGPIWDAVRASMALPGLLTPIETNGRWVVDGGLVNPVPISLCRALGADLIIAVNLNADLLLGPPRLHESRPKPEPEKAGADDDDEAARVADPEAKAAAQKGESQDQFSVLERWAHSIKSAASDLFDSGDSNEPETHTPGTMNVLLNTINIMQDRITRSRLAGEPADIMISPRLSDVGILDFGKADAAMDEGRAAVDRMLPTIQYVMQREPGFPELSLPDHYNASDAQDAAKREPANG